MQNQETTSLITSNENSTLDNLKQIDCQVGETINGDCPIINYHLVNTRNETNSTGTKTKRKTRSTRRRLNAMMNNTSLHFSDTDSEGELAAPRVSTSCNNPNLKSENNLLNPIISVTLDCSDDSSCGGDRRSSFYENLTEVDELYTSELENNDVSNGTRSNQISPRNSLNVIENTHQGETDLEDFSNDDDEILQTPIYVEPRTDILRDLIGETITTKEGDGPFSIEVRNQMSIDDIKTKSGTPDILVMPTTDTEDMEASDEDESVEEACARRELYDYFNVTAASQIVMKNVDKMQHLLSLKEPEDTISESHTDIEDVE